MRLTLRQKEIATGLAAPLLALLVFGLGEAAIYASSRVKYGAAADVDKTPAFYRDAVTGLRLPRPGLTLGKVQINSAGMRGPEIPRETPLHTVRIGFLGSSTTYEADSGEGQNWPALTAGQVAARLPPGCHVDYLNGALPGFGTPEMTTRFRHHLAAYAPDLVVILPGDVTNDIQDDLRERGIDPLASVRPSWLAAHSLLWEKIEKNLRVIRLQRSAFQTEGKIPFDADRHAQVFSARLRELVASVQQAGSIPVLVTVTGRIRRDQSAAEQIRAAGTQLYYNPYTSIPTLLEARDAYNASIRTTAQATGAALVAAQDQIPGDAVHFVDSMHFSAAGSAAMARRVADAMLQSATVAERIRGRGGACAGWRAQGGVTARGT